MWQMAENTRLQRLTTRYRMETSEQDDWASQANVLEVNGTIGTNKPQPNDITKV